MAEPTREKGSVYRVVSIEKEFSWVKGTKKTRILSRDPMTPNEVIDKRTWGSNGVEITVIGNTAVRAVDYWFDPDECHHGYPRFLERGAVNNDYDVKEYVRYIPDNLATVMKIMGTTAKETASLVRRDLREEYSD